MTTSTGAGFAGPLLGELRRKMKNKEQLHAVAVAKHEQAMTDMRAHAAALVWIGDRSRGEVLRALGEEDTPSVVAEVVLDAAPLTIPEVRMLLSMRESPHTTGAIRKTLTDLQTRQQDSFSQARQNRIAGIVKALVEIDVWPTWTRLEIALGRAHLSTVDALEARVAESPKAALTLGMYLGRVGWRPPAARGAEQLMINAGTPHPWFRLGMAMAADRLPIEIERDVRARLLALPLEVALPVAEQLGVRTTRGVEALLKRLAAVETVVTGVTSPPLRPEAYSDGVLEFAAGS